MLDNIDIFAGISRKDLESVEAYIVRRTYRKNTVIIEKGDEAAAFYVILSGSAKAYIADEEGKEIVLSIMEPGEYFGELALLGESERTASVMTLEDSRMAVISKMAFTEYISKNPDIGVNIIGGLIRRINYLTQKVSDLGLKDVYGRVVSLLQQRAKVEDENLVTGQMTQQQIADEVGSAREMVTRVLKDLKFGGYVSVEGKRYTIEKKLPAKW